MTCDCDPRFSRAIVLTGTEPRLEACLCCGAIQASVLRGDDGRYSGRACYTAFEVPLAPDVGQWFAQWPRAGVDYGAARVRWPMPAAWVRYPKWYFPASTRCREVSELEALESRLRDQQAGHSQGRLLREAGCPVEPPPAGIPRGLEGWVDLWEVMRLRPDSDLKKLVRLAQMGGGASEVAAELLCGRADAGDVMEYALRSDEAGWRSAGMAMALAGCGGEARLGGLLMEILEGLPLDPLPDVPDRLRAWERFEGGLLVIAERRLAVPRVLDGLPRLRKRIAMKDPGLVDAMRLVENELRSGSGHGAA